MAYKKQEWIDHIVADDDPELVIVEGSLLEAKRFNHMEDGIADCDLGFTDLRERVIEIEKTITLIKERGFVASVELLMDEEERERQLKFVRSDGSELIVPLSLKSYYQVNYYDGDTLIYSEQVEEGKKAKYKTIPERLSTPQYDYIFSGWSSSPNGEVEDGIQNGIEEDKDLYAIFEPVIRSYTVTFMQGEEVLQENILEYGEVPEYLGEELTNDENRPFDKWVPALGTVTQNIIYKSSFKHRLDYYDGDTLLKTEYVGDGETPNLDYSPLKEAEGHQYFYALEGWTTIKGGETPIYDALSPLHNDRTLYAIFSVALQVYTVAWNMNGEIINETYFYGQTPVPPTVSAVEERSFSSWDQEIVPVTENITYTARYQCIVNFYNGSTLLKTQYVDYGGKASYSGSTPTKSSTAAYTYSFSGWRPSLTNITEDTDAYAQFSSSIRYYTVKFYNGSTLLQTKTVAYGGGVSYTGSTPTKAADAKYYSYTFEGWSATNGGNASSSILSKITSNISVYAAFRGNIRSFNVYFYNGSTLLQTHVTPYGYNATYTGSTPTKASTSQYTYTFSGWSATNGGTASSTILQNITANKTVYAAFIAKAK